MLTLKTCKNYDCTYVTVKKANINKFSFIINFEHIPKWENINSRKFVNPPAANAWFTGLRKSFFVVYELIAFYFI